jgi:uncharacterized membrane protein
MERSQMNNTQQTVRGNIINFNKPSVERMCIYICLTIILVTAIIAG